MGFRPRRAGKGRSLARFLLRRKRALDAVGIPGYPGGARAAAALGTGLAENYMARKTLRLGHFTTPFDGEVACYELGLHRLATYPPPRWDIVPVQLGPAPAPSQAARLTADGADLFMLHVYRDKVLEALALLDLVAQHSPTTPVIWCGWTAHAPYIQAITQAGRPLHHPNLLVVSGEVEAAIPSVLDALESGLSPRQAAESLSHVTWFDLEAQQWVGRGEFAEVADVTTLPNVWAQPNPIAVHPGGAGWIELLRGCNYSCAFCIACSMKPGQLRTLPKEVLQQEVASAHEAGVSMFGLLASATNYDLETLETVVSALHAPGVGPVSVAGTVHARYLDDTRFDLLSSLRWETMIVGLQTLSPKAQRLMRRKEDPQVFSDAIHRLATFHTPEVELILGLPGDTAEGFKASVEFVLGLPVSVSVYRLRLDPWSIYLTQREEMGIKADFANLGRVTAVPGFPKSAMDQAEEWLLSLGKSAWAHKAKRLIYDGRSIWPRHSFRPQN